MDCRSRERTMSSQRGDEETNKVYEQALLDSGWRRWTVAGCAPDPIEGKYSCWRRDEFTLDLWVRPPPCAKDLLRLRPTVAPGGTPEPQASAVVPSGAAGLPPCEGSLVTIKVSNAIADVRYVHPEQPNPLPTLEDGLTDEDLKTVGPTPTPSAS
jgi:hypothetical protein